MDENPNRKLKLADKIIMFFQSPRGKAIIKLIICIIILLLFRVFLERMPKKTNNYYPTSSSSTEKIKIKKTYNDYLNELKTKNYNFLLKITDGETINYIGGEKKNNEISGYINQINGEKFLIIGSQTYNITNGLKNKDSEILSKYNYLFLNAEYIVNLINTTEAKLSAKDNKTIYTYEFDEYVIAVTYLSGIKEINIKFLNSNILYTISFSISSN